MIHPTSDEEQSEEIILANNNCSKAEFDDNEKGKMKILKKLKKKYEEKVSKRSNRSNLLRDPNKIITDIYITINNRIEIDPIIMKKLHFKLEKRKEKNDNQSCCMIY